MRIKEIVACLAIEDGRLYLDADHNEGYTREEIPGVMQSLNNLSVDRLVVSDKAQDEQTHTDHTVILKMVCAYSEVPVTAGGYMRRMDDVKKYFHAGVNSIIIEASSDKALQLLKDTSGRFGRESVMLGLTTVDIMFKHRDLVESSVDRLLVLDRTALESASQVSTLPILVIPERENPESAYSILSRENVTGVAYAASLFDNIDVMALKQRLYDQHISVSHLEPRLEWSGMKTNEQGLVPVVVQDYISNEVLMLAYMNEESFRLTLMSGKMTYWSRSRQEIWVKGETSGHYQYVKSLTADCDHDTILARVSQIGAACHTGNRSCFFYNIIQRETNKSNPLSQLLETYNRIRDRKETPDEGSLATYLFEKGTDKILTELSKENAQILLAAKNGDPEVIKMEISDYLYLLTMLMVENNITFEEIISELSYRE